MSEGLVDLRKFQSDNQVYPPFQAGENVEVSIVIPLYNENANIPELY